MMGSVFYSVGMFVLSSTFLFSSVAGAQGQIAAGSIKLDSHLALPEQSEFDVRAAAYLQPETVGSLTERWEAAQLQGKDVLVKKGTQSGAENYTEELVMDRLTLLPLSYHLESSNQTIDVRYEGLRVKGQVTPKGKEARAIDTSFDKPRYAGNAFFLILRSLDIGPQLEVKVPFFRIFDLKPLEVHFYALGSDELEIPRGQQVPVWLIGADIDTAHALYWIRKDNHELMKVVTFGNGGFEFKLTPKR